MKWRKPNSILPRTEYLKNPKRWYGTEEELDLVDFCIEDIRKTKVPEYKKEYLTDEKLKVEWDNKKRINDDTARLMLSKKVLEVYDERNKRSN